MTRIAITLSIVLFAVGRFQGKSLAEEDLHVPPTLQVYEEPSEHQEAKGMLNRLMGKWGSQATRRRERELAALKSPEHWRERQRRAPVPTLPSSSATLGRNVH